MIQKLRRRFITIAMLSTTLVLLLIIGAINVINYVSIHNGIEQELTMILENDGTFPQFHTTMPEMPEQGNVELPEMPQPDLTPNGATPSADNDFPRIAFEERGMSKESPFDTRYFSVEIDGDGNVVSINTNNIYFLAEDDAIEYALAVDAKGKSNGTYMDFMYASKETDNGTLYAFVYYGKEFATFRDFLLASAGISLGGLLVVFILLLVSSKFILKPVQESYAKQKRFITDASHELKTPLTVINANTEILEMEAGENEWTTSIKKQTKRLSKLTESLVLLTRMDEEQKILERVEFNLSNTVTDLAESYEPVAIAKGYSFAMDIEEGITYEGDESRIGQLLGILLDNAMKYTSPEGSIRVTLKTDGNKKVLRVWNTVEEIEKGKLDYLFDRFYRRDQSRNEKTGGFGIGLSVARAIAESHKASLRARSEDGKSIEFKLTL